MKFPKYPKIKLIGSEDNREISNSNKVYIEEKLDGANIRIYIKDGRWVMGSRNVQITDDKGELQNERFRSIYDYIKNKMSSIYLNECDDVVIFGEGMLRHTIDYDWERTPLFIAYDVYDVKSSRFLGFDEKSNILVNNFKFTVAPLIDVKSGKELIDVGDKIVPKSAFYDGYAEGVVFKDYERQIFAKYVRDEFREKNKIAFGGSKKYAKDDTEKVLFMCVTNRRIEKIIQGLIDDGHELSMHLMKHLPKAVLNDIAAECNYDIFNSHYVVDFGRLHKLIAKRCAAVIKQFIVNTNRR